VIKKLKLEKTVQFSVTVGAAYHEVNTSYQMDADYIKFLEGSINDVIQKQMIVVSLPGMVLQ